MSRGCWLPLYTHLVRLSHPVVFYYSLASSFSLSEAVDHAHSSLLSFSPSAETMESSLTLLLPFIFSHWTLLTFLLLSHLSLLPLAYFESSSLFWKIRVAYQLATLLLAAGRSNLPCHLSYLPKYCHNLSVHWQLGLQKHLFRSVHSWLSTTQPLSVFLTISPDTYLHLPAVVSTNMPATFYTSLHLLTVGMSSSAHTFLDISICSSRPNLGLPHETSFDSCPSPMTRSNYCICFSCIIKLLPFNIDHFSMSLHPSLQH